MTTERIKFPLFDLEKERILRQDESYIELLETCFVYRIKLRCEEEDEVKGWREREVDFTQYIERASITFVSVTFTDTGKWKLLIAAMGGQSDTALMFNTKVACERVFNKVLAWKFGIKNPDQE